MNLSTVSSLFKKTMQREKKIICDYYDTQKKYEVFFRRDNRSTSPQGKMRLYYENSQGIQIGTIYNYKNKNYLVVSQDAQESEVYYTSLAVRCDTEIDITCVIFLAWFIWNIWMGQQDQNKQREDKLYEFLGKAQAVNEELTKTNSEFVEVLHSYKSDLDTIKNDVTEIKQNMKG